MRKLLAPALVLALAAAAPDAAAAAGPVRTCETAGRPLAGTAQVRVYRHIDGDVVYACSLQNGRRIRLGDEYVSSTGGVKEIGPIAVAGRLVAWGDSVCRWDHQPVVCTTYLTIADVAKRKRRLRRRLDDSPRPGVAEIVLRPDGSAAWIEARPGARTLLRLDARGETVLAEDDSGAIALSDESTLYWTQAGVPRSATLEPTGRRVPLEVRSRRRCGRFGHTWASTAWGRALQTEINGFKACSTETGRIYNLGETYATPEGEERFGPVAMAARLLAYYRSPCRDARPTCETVRLLNLRTGRDRTLAQVPWPSQIEAIVVKRSGSVAFVQDGQIRLIDRRGDGTLGPGGDLALSKRSVVYWTGPDGTPRAAAID